MKMERLRALLEPGSCLQICWTFILACLAQLGTASAIVSFVILIYILVTKHVELKVKNTILKMKEAEYSRFCKEIRELKDEL